MSRVATGIGLVGRRTLARRSPYVRRYPLACHWQLRSFASESYKGLMRSKAYVGGSWVDAASGKTFGVYNPATGALLTEVPDMQPDDVHQAVATAHSAFLEWREWPVKDRSAVLRRWFESIVSHADELGQLLSAEAGKPLAEAVGEVHYGASFVEWFAEQAKREMGQTIPAPDSSRRFLTILQPVGVAALVTPWNFPIAMITRKAGPALAAGCSVVIKPAEDTPLSCLALCDMASDAGLPSGVLNVVTTSRDNAAAVGSALCEARQVRKLSFTGSTAVGKLLTRQCADTLKKVSMELGGNAPFIVFDDADLDAAVDGAIAAKFRNAGQTCVCANRIFVQDGIYEEFAKRLNEKVAKLNVGVGDTPGVDIGPLINAAGVEKATAHVADAVSRGAVVTTGGSPVANSSLTGYFFEPTVVVGATPSMRVFSEETFGPVAPLFRFQSEAEVVSLANDSDLGLAGYVYTRDIGRAWRMGEALEVGMVGLNAGLISNETAPFGGVKESGLGREGGTYGLADYQEVKYVCLGGIDK